MRDVKNPVYLPISFWNKDATPLHFVNAGDFDVAELHTKLGIAHHPLAKNLSTSNRDEILRRQEIVRLLYSNKELRNLICDRAPHFDIPAHGQSFIGEFNPNKDQNRFWKKMAELDELLTKARLQDCTISREIVQFHQFLQATKKNAEADEKEFAGKVNARLEKIATMQGKVTLVTKGNDSAHVSGFELEKAVGYGYRKYSYFTQYSLIEKFWDKMPDWLWYLGLAIVFPLGLFILIYNGYQNYMRYSPLILDTVPKEITDEILDVIKKRLLQNVAVEPAESVHMPRKISVDDRIRITLYFSYDSEKGLSMQFINLETIKGKETKVYNPFNPAKDQIDASFKGYSIFKRMMINLSNDSLMRGLKKTVQRAGFTRDVCAGFEGLFPGVFERSIEISRIKADAALKYQDIAGIFELAEVVPLYDSVLAYRKFIGTIFGQLQSIGSLVTSFEIAAQKWKVPVSFPKILDSDKHLITFTELIPVHLIDRKATQGDKVFKLDDLRPIHSLAPLNGKMLALTGQNAGGKTVTMETLITSVYLAQSGLPIFGTAMQLNPKKTIAMVFIERGNGSTAELLLLKIKNVLQAIAESTENGILVVMDELGTGTQEAAGADFGMQVLKKLASKKCSVIFSSQITSLVQYSEDQYGALPFKFNLEHEIEPGIGTGDMGLLVKKFDMEKYLTVQ